MAFVKEIGMNGVLYSGIYMVKNRIESKQIIRKSIAINRIKLKKGYQ